MEFNPITTSATSTLYYKNGQLHEESVDNRVNNICRRIFCRSCYNPNLILTHIKSKVTEAPLTLEQRELALENYSAVIERAEKNLTRYQNTNFIIKIFKFIFFGKPPVVREDLLQFGTQLKGVEETLSNLEKFAQEKPKTLSDLKQYLEPLTKHVVCAYQNELSGVFRKLFPIVIKKAQELENLKEECPYEDFDNLLIITNTLSDLLSKNPIFEKNIEELKNIFTQLYPKQVLDDYEANLKYNKDSNLTETLLYDDLLIYYSSNILDRIEGANQLKSLLGNKERSEQYMLRQILEHLKLFYIKDLKQNNIYSKVDFDNYFKKVNVAELTRFIQQL